jgi:hypothetical protein
MKFMSRLENLQISASVFSRLVLNWFIHNGYGQTAKVFLQEQQNDTNVEDIEEFKTIQTRQRK